eukprot:m.68473 g.68473  ORF g.68473 m.68473 type:complete len:273 (+) comp23957_c1_seq1:198-1016(+)
MEVGQHCSHAECAALDFLPFTCEFCKQPFCKEHHVTHACSQREAALKVTADARVEDGKTTEFTACNICGLRDYTVGICKDCKESHCLKHRHPDEHVCPVLSARVETETQKRTQRDANHAAAKEKTLETVNQTKEKRAAKTKVLSAKKQRTANLVKLMAMKQKAQGNKAIAQDQRFYLNVIYDTGVAPPVSKPLFFAETSPVGKVLDLCVATMRLPKNTSASPRRVYGLCNDGSLEALGTSETLKSSNLESGSTVVLSASPVETLRERSASYQ